ncbi:MAG: hypothetical protein HZA89_05080 [Verrucomicrobia bacterium]|nr:hypothetical protein [Verrucomicrobiota bacterium]
MKTMNSRMQVLWFLLACALLPRMASAQIGDANWAKPDVFPGANGEVRAVAVDGAGNLYIGGSFTVVGGVPATNVAKWNGSSWSALGSGVLGSVWALAVSGTNLYAGGMFTGSGTANGVVIWDGTEWSAPGSWPFDANNMLIHALAVSGTNLYAGGWVEYVGGNSGYYIDSIARLDGTNWNILGLATDPDASLFDSMIRALAPWGSGVYAGGYFTTAGGTTCNYIARWSGSSWSALGSGMNGAVLALAAAGNVLYAGGSFDMAGGISASNIAKWDGSSWSALGSGMNGSVSALAVSGNDVYAGGSFATAGGVPVNGIAKWNGSSWSALGSGMNSNVYALAVSGKNVYAGGRFTTAGSETSARVALAYTGELTFSILRSGEGATLSWPRFYGGLELLQHSSDAMNTNGWANADFPIITNGAMKSAIVPLTATNRFFRLLGN